MSSFFVRYIGFVFDLYLLYQLKSHGGVQIMDPGPMGINIHFIVGMAMEMMMYSL
jgi:hypothetical protein